MEGDLKWSNLQLDLQFFAGEKTEKATPKKRQDARKKGQVAKSQDINTAIGIIACFCCFSIAVGSLCMSKLLGIYDYFFQNIC